MVVLLLLGTVSTHSSKALATAAILVRCSCSHLANTVLVILWLFH